jgi:hypothetical protein
MDINFLLIYLVLRLCPDIHILSPVLVLSHSYAVLSLYTLQSCKLVLWVVSSPLMLCDVTATILVIFNLKLNFSRFVFKS